MIHRCWLFRACLFAWCAVYCISLYFQILIFIVISLNIFISFYFSKPKMKKLFSTKLMRCGVKKFHLNYGIMIPVFLELKIMIFLEGGSFIQFVFIVLGFLANHICSDFSPYFINNSKMF